jgi:spore coat polysaccharide biosynthesis protein SpsF
MEIGGVPVLLRQYSRIRRSALAREVCVITSTAPQDVAIVDLCVKHKIPVIRGSEKDLLDRHYRSAKQLGSDYVFKIPSDCPLSDPGIIDSVIRMSSRYDYVSNYHPPTFPDGLDVEGCSFDHLEFAWANARLDFQREHTFPFIWDNPKSFSIGNLVNKYGDMFLTHRWTLDYRADFDFLSAVYKNFDYKDDFNFQDVLKLLEARPEISAINNAYAGVNWYRNHSDQLKTIGPNLFRALKEN